MKHIEIPMLFLQGSRDKLADLTFLSPLVESIGSKATLKILDGADHGFNMLKSGPKSSDDAQLELAKLTSDWIEFLNE